MSYGMQVQSEKSDDFDDFHLEIEKNLVRLPSVGSIVQAHHNLLHALPQIKGKTQGWRSKWKQITKYLWIMDIYGVFPLYLNDFCPIKPDRILLAPPGRPWASEVS